MDEFDCNDVDPSIGLCRFVGSGCTTAGASTGLFGWLGLLLVRARRSAGSSGAGGVESLR